MATPSIVTQIGSPLTEADLQMLAAVGIDRYTALPGWLPATHENDGFLTTDVARAVDAGLRCRPVHETVADTLDWLMQTGGLDHRPERDGDEVLGIDEDAEMSAMS